VRGRPCRRQCGGHLTGPCGLLSACQWTCSCSTFLSRAPPVRVALWSADGRECGKMAHCFGHQTHAVGLSFLLLCSGAARPVSPRLALDLPLWAPSAGRTGPSAPCGWRVEMVKHPLGWRVVWLAVCLPSVQLKWRAFASPLRVRPRIQDGRTKGPKARVAVPTERR